MITASLGAEIGHVITSILMGFANVAFTGSLLLSLAMMGSIIWYSKRRPQGQPVSWGEAMLAATYVTFIMFWFFGVVPDRWLNYAEGELAMRSDAILMGPGSTGWFTNSPVVLTKQAVADIVCVLIYGVGFNLSVVMWAVWQKRGATKSEEVEKSSYGRPLVKV